MGSFIRKLKDSGLALRLLTLNCRRLLRKAQAGDSVDPLTAGPTVYALERRLLDYLSAKEGWGFDNSTPPAIRQAFSVLSESLALIIEQMPDERACFFNRKLNNLEKRAKADNLRSHPPRLYFEPTNRCNLRCRMCGHSFYEGERSIQPLSSFRQIAPLFKYLDQVSLFGFGEALLVDYMAEMLDEVRPYTLSMLITNGILLTPENNRLLVDHGLKKLFVSLDATEPETYRQIRGVDKLAQVQANIRELIGYKRQRQAEFPEVFLTFVAMQRNIAQLPEFIHMAKRLGVDAVTADYLTVFSEDMREQSLFYDQERSDRLLDEAHAAAEQLDMPFNSMIKFSAPQDQGRKIEQCYEPWEFLYLRADGFTSPCCAFTDKVGAWVGEDFQAYWNSPQLQEMRRTIQTPEEPPNCRNCFHAFYRDNLKESAHLQILPESGGANNAKTQA